MTVQTSRRPVVVLRGVVRRFDGTPAVDHLSLEVDEGEILALLGPSGSGKTTVLRLVAGFERPDAGQIWIAGRQVAGGEWIPPEARGVGMVFQDYALFPHLTVAENVAFGLHCLLQMERAPRTEEVLRLVGMEAFAARYPHELSGGQQQRVALARALAPRPFAVLLDEPFSNLDADLRGQVRQDVRAILKATRTSAIFVTHDQEEALLLGDRVAVINRGRLEQVDTPERIFHAPMTRFVAAFFGRADFLPARVSRRGLETEAGLVAQRLALQEDSGDGDVELLVRPDDVAIAPASDGQGLILDRLFVGPEIIYRVQLPSGRVVHSRQPHTATLGPGDRVAVRIAPGHPLACFRDGLAVPAEADGADAPRPLPVEGGAQTVVP
ncbi:MAG: ABC transporter ATP-binding protein [Armatimonadota bacterium]|nr:ABC transporter ATP-binding protein [Armatimonadota bacterium]MDR7518420.1 ABC transporter ATP-binding protein [Armatimonadota bacterium]MDR7549328.1 ABC transporter ATP-binding protein [Armatimonadota bacterium]